MTLDPVSGEAEAEDIITVIKAGILMASVISSDVFIWLGHLGPVL